MTQQVADHSLTAGDHGTTYGGNPLATAAVKKMFELFEEENVLIKVNETAPYLEEKLEALVQKYDFLIGHRGRGLMQGLVFDTSKMTAGEVSKKALENGLIVITAGADVLRFLPPLIITKQDIDEMIFRLEKSFC